jgi:alkanesulfonate monooxygenase SsuD/methylene tetrahydromethanopterin reductase-like flavin-dependent oxidoreductase (luciferase family)
VHVSGHAVPVTVPVQRHGFDSASFIVVGETEERAEQIEDLMLEGWEIVLVFGDSQGDWHVIAKREH